MGRRSLEAIRLPLFPSDVGMTTLFRNSLRRKGGKAIRLGDQPFQILLALLERQGELVLRDDLRRRLWPNDTIVEFEHSISAAMNRLRTALGDSADDPQIIEIFKRLNRTADQSSSIATMRTDSNPALRMTFQPESRLKSH